MWSRLRLSQVSCMAMMALCNPIAAESYTGGKKLLQWGWDNPTPAYARDNIRTMEELPFDGIVLQIPVEAPADEWLAKSIFRNVRVPDEMVADDIEALQATDFQKFTDNFTVVQLNPGSVDWFDDHTTIFANVELVARLGKEGGLKGLVFDMEMYGHATHLTYPYQKYINTKSFEEYCEQVEQRGFEVVQTMNRIWPDLTIILTHGYTGDLLELEEEGPLRNNEHGLRHAFINGLVKGASDETTIIDGYEGSYGYTTKEKFLWAYHRSTNISRIFCPYKRKFSQVWRSAFALMFDYRGGGKTWDPNDFGKNYRTPDDLERDVTHAMQASDKYVWLYNERPKFFPVTDIPDVYIEAIRRAKVKGDQVVDISKRYKRKIRKPTPANVAEMFAPAFEQWEDLGTIDGTWWFRIDPDVRGFRDNWHMPDQPRDDWQEVTVPTYWETDGHPDHDGVGWYAKHLPIAEEYRGRKLGVAFGGVDEAAKVFVNGKEVTIYQHWTVKKGAAIGFVIGSRKGMNKPFVADITNLVRFGEENLLVVEVMDTRHLGGISRPVKLVVGK